MKHKLKILTVAIFMTSFAHSTWAQQASVRYSKFYDHPNHGAGVFEDVTLLNDTAIIAVGPSLNFSNGYRDAHHIIVNSIGEVLSEAVVASELGQTNTRAVLRSRYHPEQVFVSGYFCDYSTESSGPCDYYFCRVDPSSADTIFMKVYERTDTCDLLLDMLQTLPNRILLLGYSCNDTVDGDRDVLIITVDTLGNEVNRVVYGGGGTDFVRSGVVLNENGELLLTGFTESFPSPSVGRTWLVRTDSIGNVIEHKTYTGSAGNNSSGQDIIALSDGNFMLAGAHTSSSVTRALLMKVDANGDMIWQNSITRGDEGQSFWAVRELSDGTLVASGPTNVTNDGSQAGWLAKMNATGDSLWTRVYNPSDATDYLRNMLVMPNGDIVMVGFGRGENSTTQDGWILRVDSMGCVVENCFMVGVEEQIATEYEQLSIYPNPAQDVVRFQIQSSTLKVVLIEVTDIFGRDRLGSSSFAMTETLDVSRWTDGIYFITLTYDDGNRYTQRLVVQH